jgi:nicotinamide-nucleotide amidase
MAVTARARIVAVGAGAERSLEAVAAALDAAGMLVVSRAMVEDDDSALDAALAGEVDLVVVTETPGAAHLVRRAVARACGVPLALDDRLLDAIAEVREREGRGTSPRDERRALLPQGARLVVAGDEQTSWTIQVGGKGIVVMPAAGGTEPLGPLARSLAAGRDALATRTLRVTGLAAAELDRRAGETLRAAGLTGIATVSLPREGEVWLRLRARGATPEAAVRAVAEAQDLLAAALGDDVYGTGEQSLEQVVGQHLLEAKLTLAVAESCTGGLLGHRLTSVPGSSAYFDRGVLVYSNQAKQDLLGVPEAILREHGAVSAPCAEAMARGMARIGATDCALAVTGIAGPAGGTPTKPVGTVFIGLAVGDHVAARGFLFQGDRASIKWQSAQMALDWLRRELAARRRTGGAPR